MASGMHPHMLVSSFPINPPVNLVSHFKAVFVDLVYYGISQFFDSPDEKVHSFRQLHQLSPIIWLASRFRIKCRLVKDYIAALRLHHSSLKVFKIAVRQIQQFCHVLPIIAKSASIAYSCTNSFEPSTRRNSYSPQALTRFTFNFSSISSSWSSFCICFMISTPLSPCLTITSVNNLRASTNLPPMAYFTTISISFGSANDTTCATVARSIVFETEAQACIKLWAFLMSPSDAS